MPALQLDPPIPVLTPKGEGLAHVLLDYGPEYHLLWVCFQDDSGECWTWPNPEVRALKNKTMGRGSPTPFAGDAAAKAPRLDPRLVKSDTH